MGKPSWTPHFIKSLKLKDGFRISVLVVQRDPEIGFGLSIKNNYHPDGFSWEWFELEEGDVYKKLQPEGYLRVTQARSSDGVELQSVEFLSDITLRFQEDVKVGSGNKTHEIVVSPGSDFRFAP